MPEQWKRLPADDAAGKASADTVEVEIGNVTIPSWANSIKALHVHLMYLALTTEEPVSGYVRLANDKNTLDPLNLPLPLVQILTGAIGTHIVLPITYPVHHDVTPSDILRAYAAFDAATTGIHTLQAYLLFSSDKAPYNLKSQKSAFVAASTTANTLSGTVTTLSTIVDRSKELLGFWTYFMAAAGITAAQTAGGYIHVNSDLAGWLEQRIPTNVLPSGLSTQITPLSKPVVCLPPSVLAEFDGVSKLPFPKPFPLGDKKIDFKFENRMDGTNTDAPSGRYGLVWTE